MSQKQINFAPTGAAGYIDTSSEEVIINIENVINKIADIEEKEKEIDSKLNEYLKTLGFVS